MIILNFAHPLVEEHLSQIATLAGEPVERVLDIAVELDVGQAFEPQVGALVDGIGLSPQEWQSLPLVINPPSYNFAAAVLLAHLEGRMGYLPAILRLRPVVGVAVRRFEVAEIVNLSAVRERARRLRLGS